MRQRKDGGRQGFRKIPEKGLFMGNTDILQCFLASGTILRTGETYLEIYYCRNGRGLEIFKAVYGQPIATYMKEFRVRQAMKLLPGKQITRSRILLPR